MNQLMNQLMTQFPSLQKLRPLIRIEVGVLAALLLVVVIWYSFSQQTAESRDAETALDQRFGAFRSDLAAFARSNERATLQEELAALQADKSAVVLPTRDEAFRFRDELLEYVDSHNLSLNAFGQEESLTPIGEQDFPTIRYSIIVQGLQESLVGTLQLLQEFPTAVQVLELVRAVEGLPEWVMILELSVFFDDGKTQVDQ